MQTFELIIAHLNYDKELFQARYKQYEVTFKSLSLYKRDVINGLTPLMKLNVIYDNYFRSIH